MINCYHLPSLKSFSVARASRAHSGPDLKSKRLSLMKRNADFWSFLPGQAAFAPKPSLQQDISLMNAQLQGSGIHQRVSVNLAKVMRGLDSICSIAKSGVHEFRPFMFSFMTSLLEIVVHPNLLMISEQVYEAYMVGFDRHGRKYLIHCFCRLLALAALRGWVFSGLGSVLLLSVV